MKYNRRKIVIPLGVAILAILVFVWSLSNGSGGNGSPYRTALVKRGDLLASINATGTLQPEEVIDVGAQVAGRISSFGTDKTGKTIDYGSVVEAETVLARIDDSLYAADVAMAEAQLQQAQAGVTRAEADLGQLKAKLYQAERDWERARKLGPSEALAEASYDAYRSAYETAKANLAVGEAAIQQARESAAHAAATLQRAQRNLGYCTIKSPVNGVIIDRRVNIGQTVVASLNAPSLFLIAKDLTRMQVWVSVNEADIGAIHPGQPVSFSVDAYPGEVFRGEVRKIRLNASMTQNVVSYIVEVTTDNSSGRLLPYLTANVQFEIDQRTNVLLVPGAALRWIPRPGEVDSAYREIAEQAALRTSGQHVTTQSTRRDPGNKHHEGMVWVHHGRHVYPVIVSIGLTDGLMTEVQGEEVKEGLEVVVGKKQQQVSDLTASPFTPQAMRDNRPQTQGQ